MKADKSLARLARRLMYFLYSCLTSSHGDFLELSEVLSHPITLVYTEAGSLEDDK